MGQATFVVVANRLPVDRVESEDGTQGWRTSPGGLVTALMPVMTEHGGTWVGWSGSPDEEIAPFELEGYHVEPVTLSADEVDKYYGGMSNATFWPLYHDCIVNPTYNRRWWHAYLEINQRFADRTCAVAAQGATVWVQDYQLQMVPKMIREQRPDLKIGFFLHIPFPPRELFMQLPARSQVIEGLLGADVIGFQVKGGASNFIRLAQKLIGVRSWRDHIFTPDGRMVIARAYPISLDAQALLELSRQPQVRRQATELRHELGDPDTLFLGIDRLDYTKGIPQRMRAFGELLASGQLDPQKTCFLQIATPSREQVYDYSQLHKELNEMVGNITSQVGTIGRSPIVYRYEHYPREMLAAFYRAADVCVVTPLRDGMNLVAKEYIAAHDSNNGALVLSEFAGAAQELTRAYQVNPYDLDSLKAQILLAANDLPANKARRMRAMRRQVFTHDIASWARSFLHDLAEIDHSGQTLPGMGRHNVREAGEGNQQ